MQHAAVYELSKKYGPPRINLRDARILDDYGDESYATRPINHRMPEDVVREDFEFYAWVFPFMEFEDFLFYLYPIALEFERKQGLDAMESYLFSLNSRVPREFSKLPQVDQEAFKEGLLWIYSTADEFWRLKYRRLERVIGLR